MSTITTRGRYIPVWLRRAEPELQNDVLSILNGCNAIRRLLPNVNGNGDGDEADLEGARIDLRDALSEIFKKGNPDVNPLWAAVMMIRPQVINGRLFTSVTEEVAQAIWILRYESKSDEVQAFFGKLASRLHRHQINFFRTVISGREPLSSKGVNGQWQTHYFPGIPFSIRGEAGVRLTTHPDNLPAVIKAYQLMAAQTTGHAKTAIEAVVADINELSKNLYPPALRPGSGQATPGR